MADKGAPVGALFLKLNVVEARLEVDQRDILMPAEQSSVTPRFIELILILRGPFVNRDDVLHHPVSLP